MAECATPPRRPDSMAAVMRVRRLPSSSSSFSNRPLTSSLAVAAAAVLGNLPGHRDVAEKLAELKARMGTLHGPARTIPHCIGAVFD